MKNSQILGSKNHVANSTWVLIVTSLPNPCITQWMKTYVASYCEFPMWLFSKHPITKEFTCLGFFFREIQKLNHFAN